MKRVSVPDVMLHMGLAAVVAGVVGLAGVWWALIVAGFFAAALAVLAGVE